MFDSTTGLNQPYPVEPSADQRMWARGVRTMFQSLVTEGFTENQALAIIGYTIATVQRDSDD